MSSIIASQGCTRYILQCVQMERGMAGAVPQALILYKFQGSCPDWMFSVEELRETSENC